MTRRPFLVFGYEGLSVRVESGEPSHLAWLEEFLAPQFEVSREDAGSDWTLSFEVDEARFDALRKRGASGSTLPAFVLDSSVLELPVWNGDGAATALYDEKYGVFHLVEGRRATVLARENRRPVRTPLMRVVRELAMNHAWGAQSFFLHASCFSVHGAGVIVSGPRSSGKTTLLCHALRAPETAYVANDRLLVSLSRARPRVRGMPSIVSVRKGTFEFFPEMRSALFERSFHFRSTLAEAAQPDAVRPVPWDDGRMGLTPTQLCGLLDASSLREVPARALLLPRVVDREGSFHLGPLDPAEAATHLLESVFGAGHLSAVSAVFGGPKIRAPGKVVALCEQLAEAIPCFECEVGRTTYADAAAAARFADAFREPFAESGTARA